MLALDDLLPQPTDKTGRITLQLPVGWRIVSNENRPDENDFDIHDLQTAVIFIGRSFGSSLSARRG